MGDHLIYPVPRHATRMIKAVEFVDLAYLVPDVRKRVFEMEVNPSTFETHSSRDNDDEDEGDKDGWQAEATSSKVEQAPHFIARRDIELTFAEFVDASRRYVECLRQAGYPEQRCDDLASFYDQIQNHPLRLKGRMGELALIKYQELARYKWITSLRPDHNGGVLAIDKISEPVLTAFYGEVIQEAIERMTQWVAF